MVGKSVAEKVDVTVASTAHESETEVVVRKDFLLVDKMDVFLAEKLAFEKVGS